MKKKSDSYAANLESINFRLKFKFRNTKKRNRKPRKKITVYISKEIVRNKNF